MRIIAERIKDISCIKRGDYVILDCRKSNYTAKFYLGQVTLNVFGFYLKTISIYDRGNEQNNIRREASFNKSFLIKDLSDETVIMYKILNEETFSSYFKKFNVQKLTINQILDILYIK